MENREIKFRAFGIKANRMYEPFDMSYFIQPMFKEEWDESVLGWPEDTVFMQYTGLKDKNGKEIYEGDIIRWRIPYRTTQTHTGDNIPNGSYTEPMEPGIKTNEEVVIFKDGIFGLENFDGFNINPLIWHIGTWDLEGIKGAIEYRRYDSDDWFYSVEDGDLGYLISEAVKVKNEQELIEYLSGVEIIGNIFEHPHLIESI